MNIKNITICLLLTGCSLFTPQNAKTASDIARDLCIKHYGAEKPALSLDDVAKAYCKDLQPWIDSVLGAETLAASKVSAEANK